MSPYPWLATPDSDPLLDFSYDFPALADRIPFLQAPWLLAFKKPRIMVSGATGWIARYMLHVLTANTGIGEILAIDQAPRPEFLSAARYSQVEYRRMDCKWNETGKIIAEFHPQLIFHGDYVWDVHYKTRLSLYDTNVCAGELLYRAAEKNGVRRVIAFSDALVYGMRKEAADESTPLNPSLPAAKSFEQAERAAETYHHPGTEIYHIRLPALYGPEIPHGVMALAYAMAEGMILGPPEHSQRPVSILSGRNMALAAFLLAMAHQPGHRVFNAVEKTLPLCSLLEQLAALLPRGKVMGFQLRLAEIMKIGYQPAIAFPEGFLKFAGSLYDNATGFLNQMRYQRKKPLMTRELVDYLLQLPAISGKRLEDALGWAPEFLPEQLADDMRYLEEHGHKLFRIPRQREERVSELAAEIAVMDRALDIAEALYGPSPSFNGNTKFEIPQISCKVDARSLWILRESCWNRVLLSLFKGKGSQKATIMWPELSAWLKERILTLVRYDQSRARKIFPDDLSSQVIWLSQQLGMLDLHRLKYYITIGVTSDLIKKIREWGRKHRELLCLLPEKNYGLFLADERGDIGIVLQVKAGKVDVDFPREQIDSISRSDYLSRRLAEFKKLAKLHIALGVRLEKFIADLTAGSPLESITRNFGSDYLITEGSDHYSLIAKAMKSSLKNLYIILEKERAILAVRRDGDYFALQSPSYLKMVNTLLEKVKDHDEITEMIEKTSKGREQAAFVEAATARRLFEGIVAPTLIHKALLGVLEKAAEKAEKAEDKKREKPEKPKRKEK